MLCPEVWNFKAPNSNFRLVKGDLNQIDPINEAQHLLHNHLVSVVLPDTLKVPAALTESLSNDCDYYRVSKLCVAEFVDCNFVENFVKKGNLSALSIDSRIDCDDCFLITPKGKLVLSLRKESYQSLGLEGKVSHFAERTKSRYIVTVDLTDLVPGKKRYARTKECLRKLTGRTCLISWEPPDETICPSSVAKYFHDSGCAVKACRPEFTDETKYSINVPSVDFDNFDVESAYDLNEWIGAVSLGVDLDASDEFLSSYEVPQPNAYVGQVKVLQWKGFFTPEQIRVLYEEIRNLQNLGSAPWSSLYVQGFSDTPINWSENEHHFYVNGDNGYTIILCHDDKFILAMNKSSNKRYK